MKELKFAIFGDCVSQALVDNRVHTRAMGFMNWCSIVADSVNREHILDAVDELDLSPYNRRNLKLDLTKNALEYLLEEKADYLLVDANDCRMELVEVGEPQSHALYTFSIAGGALYKTLIDDVKKINAADIPFEEYASAAKKVCARIRNVYDVSEIIIHVHKIVDEYTDGNKILKFNNEKFPARKNSVQKIMDQMYEVLRTEFEGCHVIEFPDYVLGDSRHKFGACGLHYHKLYDEYGKAAIQIICENHPDEKLLLNALRDKYSLKFQLLRMEMENKHRFSVMAARLDHLVNAVGYRTAEIKLKDVFQNITEVKAYFDAINIYKKDIGVLIAVRDTPGFIRASNNHQDINKLGFEKYPAKLWYTYCGFMLKGVVITDAASDVAELPMIWDGVSYNHSIHLESHSWRKLNQSKIMVDGIEYSLNARGANIVIIDAENFEVIDSVVYDTHEPQDYFRRIKEV